MNFWDRFLNRIRIEMAWSDSERRKNPYPLIRTRIRDLKVWAIDEDPRDSVHFFAPFYPNFLEVGGGKLGFHSRESKVCFIRGNRKAWVTSVIDRDLETPDIVEFIRVAFNISVSETELQMASVHAL